MFIYIEMLSSQPKSGVEPQGAHTRVENNGEWIKLFHNLLEALFVVSVVADRQFQVDFEKALFNLFATPIWTPSGSKSGRGRAFCFDGMMRHVTRGSGRADRNNQSEQSAQPPERIQRGLAVGSVETPRFLTAWTISGDFVARLLRIGCCAIVWCGVPGSRSDFHSLADKFLLPARAQDSDLPRVETSRGQIREPLDGIRTASTFLCMLPLHEMETSAGHETTGSPDNDRCELLSNRPGTCKQLNRAMPNCFSRDRLFSNQTRLYNFCVLNRVRDSLSRPNPLPKFLLIGETQCATRRDLPIGWKSRENFENQLAGFQVVHWVFFLFFVLGGGGGLENDQRIIVLQGF